MLEVVQSRDKSSFKIRQLSFCDQKTLSTTEDCTAAIFNNSLLTSQLNPMEIPESSVCPVDVDLISMWSEEQISQDKQASRQRKKVQYTKYFLCTFSAFSQMVL